MKIYTRKTIYAPLKGTCPFAEDDDFIEVTEWANGEGFDVDVSSKMSTHFPLTYGEFDLLKKLVKNLQK